MGRIGRYGSIAVAAAVFLCLPIACSQLSRDSSPAGNAPKVRVKILSSQQQVMLNATATPTVSTTSNPQPRRLAFPSDTPVPLTLTSAGWRIGTLDLGSGVLTIEPAGAGSLAVNAKRYRGAYRCIANSAGSFDVINDVDVDSYLKGVLARELLPKWHIEAYKALAIVARTYALYEARTAGNATFDLFADERSQVYGGMEAETEKTREAVDKTAGVVVAYGQPGQEKIFRAYFSACCGGITQSATDAFGENYIEPLSDQNVKGLCSASPKYNWGPIVVGKDELTRRVKLWGERMNRPEKNIAPIQTVDIQFINRWGRPTRFVIADARGTRYSLASEELRRAVNTDAGKGTTLSSSFCKTVNDPDSVRFVEGHGSGHGVGMCQWCAEARAEAGMPHEDIVLSAFQRARLVRGY